MPKRYAVIDLGTNTFHLLIAEEQAPGDLVPIFRKREFVKLGSEGLNPLGQASYRRGLQAMRDFHVLLQEHQVEKVRAIGTAALRTASNGPDFLADVKEQTGIAIELITGDEEAVWIYKGVRQAVALREGFSLIIDIGGGSVEFILADPEKLHWQRSFPVGLAVLHQRFHHHDPIPLRESERIYAFLEEQLQPLWAQLPAYRPHTLVGAAGAFEIFADFLPAKTKGPYQQDFHAKHFDRLHQLIVHTNLEERLQMKKLPPARADLIVVAMELIHFVLRRTGIERISVSAFAMKEGILSEMG